MLNRITTAQECDATKVDSSNAVDYILLYTIRNNATVFAVRL